MTASNSTISIYSGEHKELVFTVDDLTDLIGYSAAFILMENQGSKTALISKDVTITITGNTVTVPLLKDDTYTLSGTYYYECKIIDSSQEFQIVAVGNISVK